EAESAGSGLDGVALKAESFNEIGTAFYAKSNSRVTTAVINNAGIGPLLKGYDGQDPNAKFTLYNDGTVKQNLDANGVMKAAASVFCAPGEFVVADGYLIRSYQGVPGADPITMIQAFPTYGQADGCVIDFGFDITDRFWSATSAKNEEIVGCYRTTWLNSNTQLFCYMVNGDGANAHGPLMVIIY
ncbi:hypothetical protein, partial [Vibrio sp.]|uniref:hypothetical protein n=1 Tax=Vibrio sp. TaxID=678 RepID=UPI003D0EC8E5